MGKRDKADIKYFTALPVTFAVKKYSDALNLVCDERGLERHYEHHLVKVDSGGCKATFQSVKDPENTVTLEVRGNQHDAVNILNLKLFLYVSK